VSAHPEIRPPGTDAVRNFGESLGMPAQGGGVRVIGTPNDVGGSAEPLKATTAQNFPVQFGAALDLLLLTCVAGSMDALSYLASGVFTANMTGNTVVLGLSIVGPERSRLLPCVVSLGAFALGVLLAAVVLVSESRASDATRDITTGVAIELPFAIAFVLFSWVSPQPAPNPIALLLTGTAACALGIQSVAVRRLHIAGVVTTFITGTITTAVVSLVTAGKGGRSTRDPHQSSPATLATMFLFYVLAAAAAASLRSHHRAVAVTLPLFLLVVVLLRGSTKIVKAT
jgi:uncharacterized membrane protein YoaK (UPF0700 family)